MSFTNSSASNKAAFTNLPSSNWSKPFLPAALFSISSLSIISSQCRLISKLICTNWPFRRWFPNLSSHSHPLLNSRLCLPSLITLMMRPTKNGPTCPGINFLPFSKLKFMKFSVKVKTSIWEWSWTLPILSLSLLLIWNKSGTGNDTLKTRPLLSSAASYYLWSCKKPKLSTKTWSSLKATSNTHTTKSNKSSLTKSNTQRPKKCSCSKASSKP
jgi:hypothetical protein